MRITLAFALVLLAGCTTTEYGPTCSPACAAGFHCDSGACVSDGSGATAAGDAATRRLHPGVRRR